MINIENISFSRGTRVILKDFSLAIEDGETVCLFGESGCGKTTLFRLILGLEVPDSGRITGNENKKAAVVFQENRLLPFMTVRKNITLIGCDAKAAEERLAALGLLEFADKYPRALSGGMKRRAAIARALSADFDYLLLDEPFSGMDAENIRAAARYICETAKGKTIILITHSEEEYKLMNARRIDMRRIAE